MAGKPISINSYASASTLSGQTVIAGKSGIAVSFGGIRAGRLLLIAACSCLAASLACCYLAGLKFNELRSPALVQSGLSDAAVERYDGLVYGTLTANVPPHYFHWDGLPGRAWMINGATNALVAPATLAESSFHQSRSAVYWASGRRCRFVIAAAVYDRHASALRMVFELLPDRRHFYGLAIAGGVLLMAALGFVFGYRIAAAHPLRRSRLIREGVLWFGFIGIAIAASAAFFPGVPVIPSKSDVVNINAFAAAIDRPNDFRRDSVLSVAANFHWYTPLYVRFVQAVGRMGFHYNTSRFFLCFIATCFGLAGYYRLFKLCSGSWPIGLVCSLLVWFLRAHFPAGESWDPSIVQPRSMFAAGLPWVVLLTVRHLRRPWLWSLPAVFAASLIYVHPVSAPALIGAMLMGLLFASRLPFRKSIVAGTAAGVVACLTLAPYALIYTSRFVDQNNADTVMMQQVIQLASQHHANGYHDFGYYARDVGRNLLTSPRLWPGMLAAVVLWRKYRRRTSVRFLFGAVAGFGIVTLLLPATDLLVADWLQRMPYQIDLIRGVRYLDVFAFASLLLLARHAKRPASKAFAVGSISARVGNIHYDSREVRLSQAKLLAGVVVLALYLPLAFYGVVNLAKLSSTNAMILLSRFPNLGTATLAKLELADVVKSLRLPHERVYGPHFLAQCHIPLAYTEKGLNVLAYSNPRSFIEATNQLSAVAELRTRPLCAESVLAISKLTGAELLVFERREWDRDYQYSKGIRFRNQQREVDHAFEQSRTILFQNDGYLVIRATDLRRELSSADFMTAR